MANQQKEASLADIIVGQATQMPSTSSSRMSSKGLMAKAKEETYTYESVKEELDDMLPSYLKSYKTTQIEERKPVDKKEVTNYLDGLDGPPLEDVDLSMSGDLASLVVQFEGFKPKAYWDVKQWSIGHGTRASSKNATITPEEAKVELAKELSSARQTVVKHAKKHGYDWSPNQIDALTSFTYNAGPENLYRLTDNGTRGDETISEKILEYNKADGQVLGGLVKRRIMEAKLFTQGYD